MMEAAAGRFLCVLNMTFPALLRSLHTKQLLPCRSAFGTATWQVHVMQLDHYVMSVA
jgi:hypothetical protein